MPIKRLDRRTFLRSSGVAIGLPFLDAMVPAGAAEAKKSLAQPRRMVLVGRPLGMYTPFFFPEKAGVVSPERCTGEAPAPIMLYGIRPLGVAERGHGRFGAVLLPKRGVPRRGQAWSRELNGDRPVRAQQVATDAPVLDLQNAFF